VPILVGTDGRMRMSKTTGNYIGIDEAPEEMYGKVMSIPDQVMLDYYTLVTRYKPHQVEAVRQGLSTGTLHPMQAKKQLAHEIVTIFHGQQVADQAQAHFERVFQKRDLPAEMPVHSVLVPEHDIVDLLVATKLARSKSQARQLIEQGGVRVDGRKVRHFERTLSVRDGTILQAGRRRFVRLVQVKEI
jgi:tyrosyl-tRNA synthetase